MCKIEVLTKYISQFSNDKIGDWIVDLDNEGTTEKLNQMPYVKYSKSVHSFIEDVYVFVDNNVEMELNQYANILNKCGIELNIMSMKEADVFLLDLQCVLALILGAVRADRFNEGALLEFIKGGYIVKWLERLKELDIDT